MTSDDSDQLGLDCAIWRRELNRLVRVIDVPVPARVQILELRWSHSRRFLRAVPPIQSHAELLIPV